MPLAKDQKLKTYLKIKQDPTLGLLYAFENLRDEALSFIKTEIARTVSELPLDSMMEGIKKLHGKDAEPPSDEKLLSLIRPLLPKAIHGHTPTDFELLSLIRPLIPRVEHGKTPSKKELLAIIKPLIPKIDPVVLPKPEINKSEVIGMINQLTDKKVGELSNKFEQFQEKTVENITRFMAEVKKNMRERGGGSGGTGGGMGKWIHQQFSLTSATTTVTLTYRVAGSGSVIIVRYQGQTLMYGIDFTVSNKTITLVGFTPDDGTKLDVSYVRA